MGQTGDEYLYFIRKRARQRGVTHEINAESKTMQTTQSITQKLDELRANWNLTEAQLASLLPPDTSQPQDAWALIGIHDRLDRWTELRGLKPSPEIRLQWLNTKNPHFGDHTPLEIMASGAENLAWLAYYLDSIVRAAEATPSST
jgi:hypothetical protein